MKEQYFNTEEGLVSFITHVLLQRHENICYLEVFNAHPTTYANGAKFKVKYRLEGK